MSNDPNNESIILVRSKQAVMILYGISRPVKVRAVFWWLAVIVPTRLFLAMMPQARDLGYEGDDCLDRETVYGSVVNECHPLAKKCYPLKFHVVRGTP